MVISGYRYPLEDYNDTSFEGVVGAAKSNGVPDTARVTIVENSIQFTWEEGK